MKLSLAQQIAQLEDTAPPDFDPEDVQLTGIPHEDEDTVEDSARAHYLDVGPSALRKLHDSVADPKYDGKHTTRKQLMESEEDGSSDEEEDDDDLSAHNQSSIDEDRNSPSQSEPEDSTSEMEQEILPTMDSEPPEDISSTFRKTREEDRKKGKAVSRQIAIWDSLLDARIQLQKSVTAANRLPTPSDISRFLASPDGGKSLNKMLEEAMSLSGELFELQEGLLTSNESIQPPQRKRRKIQSTESELSHDYTSQVHDASQAASTLQHKIHPHFIQTLAKWSSKIQAITPSVLLPSNRGAFSNKSTHALKSAVQLVDESLHGTDYDKILARTRVRRGKGGRVGKVVGEEDEINGEHLDVEIFDDTDFYQQLLRDVIDARGSRNEVGGAEDWMVVQQQKKSKKKVDTKASKGRKLRYEVHEKLQNFMVPVPVQGSWHGEQIDELFASLLGKGFENAGGIYGAVIDDGERDVEAEKRLEVELGEALKGGFRVFG